MELGAKQDTNMPEAEEAGVSGSTDAAEHQHPRIEGSRSDAMKHVGAEHTEVIGSANAAEHQQNEAVNDAAQTDVKAEDAEIVTVRTDGAQHQQNEGGRVQKRKNVEAEDVEESCSNNVEAGWSMLDRSEGGSGAGERKGQPEVAKEKGNDVVPENREALSEGAESLSLSNSRHLSLHEAVGHGDFSNTTHLDTPQAHHSGEGVSGSSESQDLQEREIGKKTQNEYRSVSWRELLYRRNPQALEKQVRKDKEWRKGKEKEKQSENYEGISRDDVLRLKDFRIVELKLNFRGGVSASLGEGSNRETQKYELDPKKLSLQISRASGAFGDVYKGLYDGQEVAVKTMNWGDEDKMPPRDICALRYAFTKEAAVWRKMHHPNITKFIGTVGGSKDLVFVPVINRRAGPDPIFYRANDFCFLVEEYVKGWNLREYLNQSKDTHPSGLPFKKVMKLAIQIAEGLHYMHKQNVVHRDVKCENVLVTRELLVKITDFGFARRQASDPGLMTGELGTAGYMAPEVMKNCPYNHKCDVFSFGILLWEIYHRKQVNCNRDYCDSTKGIRPPIDARCPTALARLIKHCWDGNPHIRPSMFSVKWSLKHINAQNRISDLFRDMISGLDVL